MTHEFKIKVFKKWFSKNKKYCDDIKSEGIPIYNGPLTKKFLVEWKFNTYQILTRSHMFNNLLTKTFYKNDEKQINELYLLISSSKC